MVREVIAVAIDGSPDSADALSLAGGIALRLFARVQVLCTVDSSYALKMQAGRVAPEDAVEYPAAAAEETATQAIIERAVDTLRALGVDADGSPLTGPPAREIVVAAESLGALFIVIGHRHFSWLQRLVHPSICWDILEHAHCPVLVSNARDRAKSRESPP